MQRRAPLFSLLLALAFIAGEAMAWACAPSIALRSEGAARGGAESCCCCPAGACGVVCACTGEERAPGPVIGCAGDAGPSIPDAAPPASSPKLAAMTDPRRGVDRGERRQDRGELAPSAPVIAPASPPPKAA